MVYIERRLGSSLLYWAHYINKVIYKAQNIIFFGQFAKQKMCTNFSFTQVIASVCTYKIIKIVCSTYTLSRV